MDMPIALKPTYLNMNIALNSLNFDDLIFQGNLHRNSLNIVFRPQFGLGEDQQNHF